MVCLIWPAARRVLRRATVIGVLNRFARLSYFSELEAYIVEEQLTQSDGPSKDVFIEIVTLACWSSQCLTFHGKICLVCTTTDSSANNSTRCFTPTPTNFN